MRTMKIRLGLPLMALAAVGCASATGNRPGMPSRIRTIASAGEKPLPAETGPPGERVVAGREETDPPVRASGRISGRVVDQRGQPVPGAEVRLAVGAARVGRDLRATTDEAGGFTLRGLKAGETYALIAEGDDGQGGELTGRAESLAPNTSVRISLSARDEPQATAPARASRIGKVSSRKEIEPEEEGATDEAPGEGTDSGRDTPSSRVNEEDLPPVESAESITTRAEETVTDRPTRPRSSKVSWKPGDAARTVEEPAVSSASPSASVSAASSAPVAAPERRTERALVDDEGVNPLPPAKERPRPVEAVSEPISPRPSEAISEPISAAPAERKPEPIADVIPAPAPAPELRPEPAPSPVEPPKTEAPQPAPAPSPSTAPAPAESSPIPIESKPADAPIPIEPKPSDAPPVEPKTETAPAAAPAPAPSATPAESPSIETPAPAKPDAAPAPEQTSPPAAEPKPNEPPAAISAETEPPRKPTWRELTEKNRLALASAPAAGSASVASALPLSTRRGPAAGGEAPRTGLGVFRRGKPQEAPGVIATTVQYDAKRRRIVDFQLPDLEGKAVKLSDFDSELVLIDFWGSWCGNCLESMPHLAELQKQFGPANLSVIGIATEHAATPEGRAARADEAARKVGVNYPILLSQADGKPCPLQEALHIQSYPTMILVDRSGQILWRGGDARAETLARLDRVLASRVDAGVVRR